jgi:hypothetical protein
MQRFILTAAGACLALALCACGAGAPATSDAAAANGRLTASLNSSDSINADGVRFLLSGPADALVLTAAGLSDTKAVYGRVYYDPQQEHFTGNTALPGADQLLMLFVDQPQDGYVEFGAVVPNYDVQPGLDGNLALSRLGFAPGAADVSRAASAASDPPNAQTDAITLQGTLDANNIPTLTWYEQLTGDSDNNGETNISDLSAMGKVLNGKHQPTDHNPTADADCNHDGQVTIADLTPMSKDYRHTLGGYYVKTGTTSTSFADLVQLPRTVQLPAAKAADGMELWTWTGTAALTANTYFQVEPYNADGTKRGLASANEVLLQPNLTITYTNVHITFDGADTWPAGRKATNGDYIVLLTENSVDNIDGNAEPFATESLQLKVTAEDVANPGTPLDITSSAYMGLADGGGLASVSLLSASRGKLTFHDRGRITVQTFAPGDFTQSDSISFDLETIDSLAITSASGASPQGIAAGGTLQFVATGTFDFDDTINGNEVQQDLTGYCAWGGTPDPANAGQFVLRPDIGALEAGTATSGDSISVYAEFPPTDNVTLFDNLKRSAGPFAVHVN